MFKRPTSKALTAGMTWQAKRTVLGAATLSATLPCHRDQSTSFLNRPAKSKMTAIVQTTTRELVGLAPGGSILCTLIDALFDEVKKIKTSRTSGTACASGSLS